MLEIKKIVPESYSKGSRDFQLLGHAYELIFNYLKTNVDSMKTLPLSRNINKEKLLNLVAATLGFEVKHNYIQNDLYAICTSFNAIIKSKGAITSIEKAISMLLKSQRVVGNFKVMVSEDLDRVINIYLPSQVSDLVLLEDLLDYILPAGFIYNITLAQTNALGSNDIDAASSDIVALAQKLAFETSAITAARDKSTLPNADYSSSN